MHCNNKTKIIMKRVSFEVAKAIKEVGYPQGQTNGKYAIKSCKAEYLWGGCNRYCTSEHDYEDIFYDFEEGEFIDGDMYRTSVTFAIDAPTYLEVWLWLWREKKIYIDVDLDINIDNVVSYLHFHGKEFTFNDPEGAIEEAIEYLVTNNLVK